MPHKRSVWTRPLSPIRALGGYFPDFRCDFSSHPGYGDGILSRSGLPTSVGKEVARSQDVPGRPSVPALLYGIERCLCGRARDLARGRHGLDRAGIRCPRGKDSPLLLKAQLRVVDNIIRVFVEARHIHPTVKIRVVGGEMRRDVCARSRHG